MKHSPKGILVAILVSVAALNKTSAAEADLLEPLRPSVQRAISEFDQIDATRKKELKEAAAFIRDRQERKLPADLTFICTHNSRRSHLSQLWAQTAAHYYDITNVAAHSGGTEVVACNIRTVRTLRRAGFSIVQSTRGTNPVYLAQFSETQPIVKMYSKLFASAENPQKDFAALFCCDQAAGGCPVVPGAALRLPILYVDPKVSDYSSAEEATYDERSRQIAREMFFLMSQVKTQKS